MNFLWLTSDVLKDKVMVECLTIVHLEFLLKARTSEPESLDSMKTKNFHMPLLKPHGTTYDATVPEKR